MAPAARTNKELFDKFVGLPWDTRTTLRGPRRLTTSKGGAEATPAPAMEGAGPPETPAMDIPRTPAAAPAPGTPAKEAREGEGFSSKKRTMEEDVQHLLARRAAEDAKIARTSGSSGSRAEEAELGEMDTQTERKRAPMEPETGTKRRRRGSHPLQASGGAGLDHFEEFDEAWVEAEGDADFSDRIPEVMAGKRAELAKMDKYDTSEPRPSAKKILDRSSAGSALGT